MNPTEVDTHILKKKKKGAKKSKIQTLWKHK